MALSGLSTSLNSSYRLLLSGFDLWFPLPRLDAPEPLRLEDEAAEEFLPLAICA